MNKYICVIGPDETYTGGMLTVIHQIMETDLQIDDVAKIHIGTASKRNVFWKILTFIKGIIVYIRLCLKHQVALAHIQLSEGASIYRTIILINISRVFGINTIVHSHGGLFYDQINSMSDRKYKFIKKNLRKADRIIVLTDGWKKIWCEIVDESKIRVIPNGIVIPDMPKKEYFHDEKYNLLFLGNISPIKGIYDLIDALNILVKTKIPVILRVAGGDEIEKCKQYIRMKNLDEVVEVLGWIDGNDKEKIFEISDVLILPSYFESFGLVSIEALAHRIPVICGDKGFTKEIVKDNEMGFVCKTGDPIDISDKIIKLYDRVTISKFADKGYCYVKENYSIDVVLENLKNVYMELI